MKMEKETKYTLELNEKQAGVIATLLGRVSGTPITSEFRKIVNELWDGGFKDAKHIKGFHVDIPAPLGEIE